MEAQNNIMTNMETMTVDQTVEGPPGIQYIEVVASGFSQPIDLRTDSCRENTDLTPAISESYTTFCMSENDVLQGTSTGDIVNIIETRSPEVGMEVKQKNAHPTTESQVVFATSPELPPMPGPSAVYVKTLMINGHQQTMLVDGNDRQVTAVPTDMDMVSVQNGLPLAANPMSLCNINSSEEPLYVNAKQYHRILKRREARAKLEQRHKIYKERSKFIYNSRHLHATKRMRGPGGKFLKRQAPGKENGKENQ